MQRQRFSHQREEIYQTVMKSHSHPTAEMVYQHLKPFMPRLSLGTVYRNLHQMAQEGRLKEIAGPVARFDGNTTPHTHLRCICCGGISDLEELAYDAALDRLAEQNGAVITEHHLTFVGFCPACAGKKGNSSQF
jgi:Fe2+ or Zn2+ uptake regulation protein